MIKFLVGFNEDINKVVLTNALGNSKFTSPAIQKRDFEDSCR